MPKGKEARDNAMEKRGKLDGLGGIPSKEELPRRA